MKEIFKSFWKTLLLTTLVVGINDLILPCVMITLSTGQFPFKMLHFMAGGALGLETSMAGGFWTAALGLLFHFIISFAFTLLVFLLFPLLKLYRFSMAWMVVFSFIHAIFVTLWMRFVVLPLTLLPPQKPFVLSETWPGLPLFALVFSFPILWAATKYYRGKMSQP
jgi:hypothetical protein